MAAVRFYTGLDEPLEFAARLLRKAQRQGLQVCVLGPTPSLRRLSQQLWGLPGFVAHAGPGATPAVQARSPIRMAERLEGGAQAVLNLHDEVPAGVESAQTVFEVVGRDPQAVRLGRQRFKAYGERGCALQHIAAEGS